ncbi:putative cysteine dioxygenase Cdo1 [Aspergillus puulaauensis]|uniref:Cysteine dioxygenase n=1 Tax=Aspergillus puulaauensis TaxID=1220207 RepID=A0A7R7XM66_9EURO|nr:uncharacterized protein APUU_40268A [Aspergillus puulaauensis]BCS23824.1 hypothetical protein APUU_40268A [Aspergillus puulaauensis]
MELYTSNQDEWHSFALEDLNRSYTRNLIDEGNGKSNLVSSPVLTGIIPYFYHYSDQPIGIDLFLRSLYMFLTVLLRARLSRESPGRGSTIHDHANAHCVMKVLKGTLQETLYTWPDQERVERGQVSPPQVKKVTTYGENQVTYMSDKLGLHRIHNPDPNDVAISLHLYTPPNAANYGFSIFDETSGKACHIKQSHFYSIRGERT